LAGKPNGGVYQSSNLGLFTYTGNNPILYTDPSGQFREKGEGYLYTAHNGMQAHAQFSNWLKAKYGPKVQVDTSASAILWDFFGVEVKSNLRPDAVFNDGDTLELKPVTHINQPTKQEADEAQLQGYIDLSPENLRKGDATKKVPLLGLGGPLTIGEIKSETDGKYYNVNIYGGKGKKVPKGFVYYSLTPSDRQGKERAVDAAKTAAELMLLRKPSRRPPPRRPSPEPVTE
jgi:hypothetical protein